MTARLRLRWAILKYTARIELRDVVWGFLHPGAAIRSNLPIR